jgi:AbrB family looped-hinge helix DNA binding protein
MRITSKGQVTIPKEIREKAGLLPGADVEFKLSRGEVRIVRSSARPLTRGEQIVRRLRGTASLRMSTDELMKLTRG